MSFSPKTDWIGLADDAVLKLRSNGDGASNGNLEIPGSKGDIIGNETYGHIKAPTCDYAIVGVAAAWKADIGVCHNEDTEFALQSYSVHTGAGQEPTFNASSVQIETNSDHRTLCVYHPSTIRLSPARHASDFGCINTWTETASLALQTGDYTAEAQISPSTINGDPVASDSVMGKETVQLTFWTDSDVLPPAVTVNTTAGWRITADWACTGPDSSMFAWTATFEKYMTADED